MKLFTVLIPTWSRSYYFRLRANTQADAIAEALNEVPEDVSQEIEENIECWEHKQRILSI